ncbi:MAG: RHS repeat domain-containing protein, partial [Akkermansia sp.]
AIDAISGTFQWFLVWDPTQSPRGLGGGLDKARSGFAPEGRAGNGVPASQPIATRPLAIRKDGTWYAYGCDLTKNICEVFGPAGYLRTAYTYTPYGENNASGDVEQFIQWSSEFNDAEFGLVYYNYIHYNPIHGRWISRDIIKGKDNANPYVMVYNSPSILIDKLGKNPGVVVVVGGVAISTAEAVAAAFGLTLSACLLNKECREAVKQALSDLVSAIDEATRNTLFVKCKYISNVQFFKVQ